MRTVRDMQDLALLLCVSPGTLPVTPFTVAMSLVKYPRSSIHPVIDFLILFVV